uniref:Calpain small subunit 2 n=1 Tax=Salvator merianae TaxID=96440 RepID=A0A8D0BA21_SALMN
MFLVQALVDAATSGGGGGGGGKSAGGALLRSIAGGGGKGGGGAGGALLKSIAGGGGGGGGGGAGGALVRGLGGLLSGGSGGGKAGNIAGLLGGLVNIISEAAAQYTPEPPPAPHDMAVCPTELMNILNKVLARHQDLKAQNFSLDTCRSMVSVMDSDTTGKLDFYQFRYLWNNIKKWQCVFKEHCGPSGAIEMGRLPAAFKAAGFNLHEQLYALIIRRYADDEDGSMDFNNFISCLVRLDGMFRAFKALDRDGSGKVQMNLQDWLQLTMYS